MSINQNQNFEQKLEDIIIFHHKSSIPTAAVITVYCIEDHTLVVISYGIY